MSEPFLGEIKMFGGNFAPRGYAFCAGQLFSVSQNTALYAILGTTFGGNGQTTFALPDLQGRSPVGTTVQSGSGLRVVTLGEAEGTETNSLTFSQMPPHNHVVTLAASLKTADTDIPGPAQVLAKSTDSSLAPANIYGNIPASTDLTTLHGGTCSISGSGQPISNLSPYLGVSMIIATQGMFPMRN
ncbi:phage tail protein [Pseudomonas sp. SDI]|uniref:phage tail protein n=1 Tax=Pseudomonas sp. SDI TaxID=2170734 RepID=UPI000DE6A6B6|nr:tail fiber protein [Pseudomonas sp. SDI]PWB30531.1 phage tail protein [Pseudomonas sp. SDI]